MHLRNHRPSVAVSAAITVLLSVLVTSCTSDTESDEKQYAVPSTLCGVPFDTSLIGPFLPAGRNLSVKQSSPNGGTTRCDVNIDGELAIRHMQTWWADGENAATVSEGYDRMEDGQLIDDERYFYSGTGAVGKTSVSCKSPEHPEQRLYGVVQVYAPGRSDAKAMKKLVLAYTEALDSSSACHQ
ncbi:hypothetical protein ACF1AO_07650 [Streptomyces longwoodensis]|uniref:hypothetical protein n=1 Tax=Streptomyces longwoodensis TaxID=68231 RepID=UPI0036F8EF0F